VISKLALIHTTCTSSLAGFQSVYEREGGTVTILAGPAAATVAREWDRIRDVPDILTHCDFWSGNVVWEYGVPSGIVDWSGGPLGPARFRSWPGVTWIFTFCMARHRRCVPEVL
jgi:hypothetical protein